MNAPLKAILLFALAQIYVLSVSAQVVVANDAAILPLLGQGQYLTLTNSINPSQGRFGLFAIEILSGGGSQFTFNYAGVAEEYALYSVTPGIAVDAFFASATTPLVSNNGTDPGSSVETFLLGQTRYFAYWDDRPGAFGFGDGVPDMKDNYGWVAIRRTVPGLVVTSSATALGGGIIAGTFTPVPEPSIWVLGLLGLGLILCARRSGFRCAAPPNHALHLPAIALWLQSTRLVGRVAGSLALASHEGF